MKIIHITKISGIGGIQSLFERTILGFKKIYPQVEHELFTLRSVSKQSYINNIYGIKGILLLFFRALDKENIFHSYNNIGSIKFFIFFLITRPKNLIFHERGNAWNINSSRNIVVKLNYSIAKIIICNSKASKYILINKFHLPEDKIKVIYNGVYDDIYLNEALNINEKFYSKKNFKVLFIGRIETNKGLHSLINSFKLLDPEVFCLDVIGDGSLMNKIKQLVLDLKLNNINFLGYRKNIYDFLNDSNLLVVPSIREPLGNVVIEAAISNTPIIASKVDGIVEIIENESYGSLIMPRKNISKEFTNKSVPVPEYVVKDQKLSKPKEISPEELAKKIYYIYNNYEEALHKARLLKGKTVQKFSLMRFVELFYKAYNSLKEPK